MHKLIVEEIEGKLAVALPDAVIQRLGASLGDMLTLEETG